MKGRENYHVIIIFPPFLTLAAACHPQFEWTWTWRGSFHVRKQRSVHDFFWYFESFFKPKDLFVCPVIKKLYKNLIFPKRSERGTKKPIEGKKPELLFTLKDCNIVLRITSLRHLQALKPLFFVRNGKFVANLRLTSVENKCLIFFSWSINWSCGLLQELWQ